jgi:hypothetical protein
LAHLYSSWLLIEVGASSKWTGKSPLSKTGQRHRARAININMFVFAVLAIGALYRYLY